MEKKHLLITTITKYNIAFSLILCFNHGFSQTNLIQNPTADFYTFSRNENADAFDMTPPPTLIDNSEATATSPYLYNENTNPYGWNNTALEAYISERYGNSEQPASTADGSFYNSNTRTRALKLYGHDRRIYQLIQVTQGANYTFTVDTRSEDENVDPEIFILNNEISTESNIDSFLENSPDVDAYLEITNDFNSHRGNATTNTFTTSTLTFTASTNVVVVYIRAIGSDSLDVDNLSLTETTTLTDEFINSNKFSTFPNPVKDVLNIESSDYKISSVVVKNMLGQKLIYKNDNTNHINISSLSNGIYLLVIRSGDKVTIKKIIKE